jgi:hypothetical protein
MDFWEKRGRGVQGVRGVRGVQGVQGALSRSLPRCGLTVHLSNLYLRKPRSSAVELSSLRGPFLCFLRLPPSPSLRRDRFFAAIPVFFFHLCVLAALRENQSRG